VILATAQLASVVLAGLVTSHLQERPVKVTVLVVLATAEGQAIEPKLRSLAVEVRKREPNLSSFKHQKTIARSIVNQDTVDLEVLAKQILRVKVEQPRYPDGRVKLTIRPPGLGEITYECVCGKYFPVVTPHVTANGERLILAIMATPCLGK
jgi:hypothetical protein